MTLLLPVSRRRAENFARALDSGTPEPTVASLFALADELATMPLGPDAEFRSRLRRQLVMVAADPPPRVIRTGFADRLDAVLSGWRGQRRLAFAAGMLAVVLLLGGVGLLSSRSIPGEPFYAAKRAVESVQLATAHGKLARGQRHLQFATTRMREVSALVGRNNALAAAGPDRPVAGRLALDERTTKLVLHTLSDMERETLAGTRDLTEYWRESGQRAPLKALDAFAQGQHAQLAAVLPALPVSARDPGLQMLALISSVGERAQALIDQGPCDAACRAIAGGATMSGGFDVLGPKPCPDICPGSGGAQAPAATVTTVNPTPVTGVSPNPLPTPSGAASSSEPEPSVQPLPSTSPPPVETSPSPLEVSPPPMETSPPVEISPSPTPMESPSPSPVESPSPTDTPPPPTGTPTPPDPSPSDTPGPGSTESPSPATPEPSTGGSPPPPVVFSSPLPPVL